VGDRDDGWAGRSCSCPHRHRRGRMKRGTHVNGS
jgi:hypothetical protein